VSKERIEGKGRGFYQGCGKHRLILKKKKRIGSRVEERTKEGGYGYWTYQGTAGRQTEKFEVPVKSGKQMPPDLEKLCAGARIRRRTSELKKTSRDQPVQMYSNAPGARAAASYGEGKRRKAGTVRFGTSNAHDQARRRHWGKKGPTVQGQRVNAKGLGHSHGLSSE